MANSGDIFRDAVKEYIESWGLGLQVITEAYVGTRFWGTPRRMDLLVHCPGTGKSMAVECKFQDSDGTAYEKIPYALEDIRNAPIPCLLVIAGSKIQDDIRRLVCLSGIGYDLAYEKENSGIVHIKETRGDFFKQHVLILLGIDWIQYAEGDKVKDQLRKLGLI